MRARAIIHLPPGESFPVRQLAKLLGCNHQRITELIEEGALDAFDLRVPGASRAWIRIPRASVIAFLEKRSSRADVRQATSKRASKHARISPTRTRRYSAPADALMAILRSS
jgi:hypothetical protein